MAHVSYSKIVAAAPASVWEVVREFGALPRWFPFVVRTELRGGGPQTVGVIRANTLDTGGAIEERLSELSDYDRRIVYEVISGDVPTKNYIATLRIHEVAADPTLCLADWSADFDVDGDRMSVEAWVRDGIFKTCLEALERLTAGEFVATDCENTAEGHREIVRTAFEAWAAGSSDFFDLLADDAVWTITGSGPSTQTFHGRQAFLESAYRPIARTFASPMKPRVLGPYADGDEVVIRWDGEAAMKDGRPIATATHGSSASGKERSQGPPPSSTPPRTTQRSRARRCRIGPPPELPIKGLDHDNPASSRRVLHRPLRPL